MARINVGQLQQAVHASRRWAVKPKPEVSFEDLLKEATWANVTGMQVTPMDLIEVHPEDGTYWAELLVLDAGPAGFRVKALRHVAISEAIKSDKIPPGYNLVHRGRRYRFSVIRKVDGVLMRDGFATPDEALKWLEGHLALAEPKAA